MDTDITKDLIKTVHKLIHLCYDSVEDIRCSERFTYDGLREVHALRARLLQISKYLYNFNYLTTRACERSELTLDSFYWSEFSYGISELFNYVLSSFSPPKLSFTNSFETDMSFLSDRHRLDILLLNILYVLSVQFDTKEERLDTKKETKAQITFHLGGDKENFILHIRNNSKPMDDETVNSILKRAETVVPDIKLNCKNVESSIAAARKAAEELNYRLEFSTLKSGNKFEIYIPKYTDDKLLSMKSSRHYMPDDYMGLMIFSDLGDFDDVKKEIQPKSDSEI